MVYCMFNDIQPGLQTKMYLVFDQECMESVISRPACTLREGHRRNSGRDGGVNGIPPTQTQSCVPGRCGVLFEQYP